MTQEQDTTEAMIETTVAFQISGESFTSLIRDLVYEGSWRKAQDLIIAGICDGDELTVAQLHGLMRAELKFVGTNDLLLIPETDSQLIEKHAEQLTYLYGRCVNTVGRYWKPYARVAGGCGEDLKTMTVNRWHQYDGPVPCDLPGNSSRVQAWWRARATYYMDRQYDDLAAFVRHQDGSGSSLVLWKEVETPPPFIPVFCSFDDALPDPATLPLRGPAYRRLIREVLDNDYDDGEDLEETGDAELDAEMKRVTDLRRRQIIDDIRARYDKDEEERNRIWRKALLKLWEPLQKTPHTLETQDGWISPQGQIKACHYGQHLALGETILVHLLGYTEDQLDGRPDDQLTKLGWLKLQKQMCYPNAKGLKITQAQRDVMFDYDQRHGQLRAAARSRGVRRTW